MKNSANIINLRLDFKDITLDDSRKHTDKNYHTYPDEFKKVKVQ